VRGLVDPEDRLEAYRRVQAYQVNPRQTIASYISETDILRNEIQGARDALPEVILSNQVAQLGLEIIKQLQIDSLRAEITLFESARAHAVADGRLEVQPYDLHEISPLALRARRSNFMVEFLNNQKNEETEIQSALERVINNQLTREDPNPSSKQSHKPISEGGA
jgi:Mg-chelatase subunit ChlI